MSGTTKRCVCLYLELCVCMRGVHVYWIMAGGIVVIFWVSELLGEFGGLC